VTGSTAPVLLAYDGSPSSEAAIAAAGRLVRRRRAVVCNVWARLSGSIFRAEPTQLPGVLSDAAEELDQIELDAAERTAAEGTRVAKASGFEAEPLTVAEGDHTWRALLDAAQSVGASMVVTGAQGQSGIRLALLGSVSTGLVHHAELPLLIVPGANGETPTSGPVLLCYDGSESAARAIASAAQLLGIGEARVVHVWDSWIAHAPALAGVSGSVMGIAVELDEVADEQSTDVSARGVAEAARAGLEATAVSESAKGPVWRSLLEIGDREQAAAIVLGSRGLGGISAALGSVSNGVVHHSRRPVFIVPPPAEVGASEEEQE
jgi:nucleotide-binding universal stress UspA family protein